MSDELISMEDWEPEKSFFPKKDILGKKHKTYVNRGYAMRDGKRLVYYLETYDSLFGDRRVQLTNTQASRIKHLRAPFYIFFKSENTIVNGKECFSLKISETGEDWF